MSRMGISKGLSPDMRIAIIGGGLTGLAAGFRLSPSHEIIIIEKEKMAGGLLSSYQRPGYSIERYYHHFFSGDKKLLALLSDLGIQNDIVWLKGSTGTLIDGKIFPLTTPFEIIRYPYLSLTDKLKLALFTKRAKDLLSDELDNISAEEFIIHNLGDRIFRSFFRPLLISKFGSNIGEISAAWLVSRVAIRSDRSLGGERLGYLKGGFSILINLLISEITGAGGIIRYNEPVISLQRTNSGWDVNGEAFDRVIATVAPGQLKKFGLLIPDIPYQGAACLTIGLKRQVTEGIYWINLYDDAPYGAVIGHTCFAPYNWYHEHIVYLASYFTGDVKSDLKELMIRDFCHRFSVKSDDIIWAEIAVDQLAGPIYKTGYKKLMSSLSVPGLFLAGMHSAENYPERSIEGSLSAGFRVADEVMSGLAVGRVIV